MTRTTIGLRGVFPALIFSASVVSARAGVFVTMTSVPTVNLPNYTTYTLTAQSNDGADIPGFDFASQPTYGFFGAMNQVNPAGLATVFTDNNAVITALGGNVSQDSQFKFNSSAVVVPGGFASESSVHLRAIFASGVPLGTSVPFAQFALPNGGDFSFKGQIVTWLRPAEPVENDVLFFSCLTGPCGSPPQMVDDIINNVNPNVPGLLTHTISASQIAALSNFKFDSYVPAPGFSGTGPATPATLNLSTREFRWNTVGSAPGTYKWTMTAGNTVGFDNGSLTVNVIPEPATYSLVGLPLIALAFIRRRN